MAIVIGVRFKNAGKVYYFDPAQLEVELGQSIQPGQKIGQLNDLSDYKVQAQIDEQKRLENRTIPSDIDYDDIGGLRLEAIEKLKKLRPLNVGQASRISGVSPADISVLMIYLKTKK